MKKEIKSILVTGAASGIGQAITEYLAEREKPFLQLISMLTVSKNMILKRISTQSSWMLKT